MSTHPQLTATAMSEAYKACFIQGPGLPCSSSYTEGTRPSSLQSCWPRTRDNSLSHCPSQVF